MHILIATGSLKMNDKIDSSLKKNKFVSNMEIFSEDKIIEVIKREQPDVLIVSPLLFQKGDTMDMIKRIRIMEPFIRIVCLLKKDQDEYLSFFHDWLIYDVLVGKFKTKELIEAIK